MSETPDKKKAKTNSGNVYAEPTLQKTPEMKRKVPRGDISDSDSPGSDAGYAEPLELPQFTIPVKVALRDGDCSPGIWNMVS